MRVHPLKDQKPLISKEHVTLELGNILNIQNK